MTDITILEIEAAKGESHKRAWDQTVAPFFDAKKDELLEAFKELNSSDANGLMIIKMQYNVLQMMEDQFQSVINTGKMAKHEIDMENAK